MAIGLDLAKALPSTDLPRGDGSVFYEIQSIKAMRIESYRSSYKLIQKMKFCKSRATAFISSQTVEGFARIISISFHSIAVYSQNR